MTSTTAISNTRYEAGTLQSNFPKKGEEWLKSMQAQNPGSQIKEMTTPTGGNIKALISPDGKMIAWYNDKPNQDAAGIKNADGSFSRAISFDTALKTLESSNETTPETSTIATA